MSVADYDTVIGLETHVQLLTRTKLFCGCANEYGAPPNSRTCPVCLGLPGALPVANRKAFELAIRAGLALGCEIAPRVEFDRKQYFYPDLPKGYQISQLDRPVNSGGRLELAATGSGGSVAIARAHLEEDAGKNLHSDEGTLVDLNRCGVPLLEIVTEAVIDSPERAHDYLTELKLLLRHAGVGDCDMEKGSLRCDVNVSLKPRGSETLGTKIEIKNLNSFKMVRRALEHEQHRQAAILDAGGSIEFEETRLWDDERGETRLMRTKEDAADYRYFPDPDLPPFRIEDSWIEEIRASLPELPGRRRRRYVESLGISEYDAGVIVQDLELALYFEELAERCGDPKTASNWIQSKVLESLKSREEGPAELPVTPALVAELIAMTADGTVNLQAARTLYDALLDRPEDPRGLARSLGLVQMSDEGELEAVVRRALDANPKAVEDLRAGKKKAAGAILGWVMRETGGAANPGKVNEIIGRLLA